MSEIVHETGKIVTGKNVKRGRPKVSYSIKSLIKREFEKRVEIVEQGKRKKIRVIELLVRRVMKKAIEEGDTRIIMELMHIAMESESIDERLLKPLQIEIVNVNIPDYTQIREKLKEVNDFELLDKGGDGVDGGDEADESDESI